MKYKTIVPSKTNEPLSTNGASGDLLENLLIVTTGLVGGTITVKDGNVTILSITLPTGVNTIPMNLTSQNGQWNFTTSNTATIIASGVF